ncbi:MAG: OmpA family protein [Bacteroidetes bacterium]|nr:OmpA family protein [Bacteroidota bacterium]
MGGYDIFSAEILPDGNFSDPVHLGYPINTTDDDLYFYPVNNGKLAYLSRIQKGNLGFEDIFRYNWLPMLNLTAENLKSEPAEVRQPEPVKQEPQPEAVQQPENIPAVTPVVNEQPKALDKPQETDVVKPQETPKPEPVVLAQPEVNKEIPQAETPEEVKPEPAKKTEEEPIVLHSIFFEFNSTELNENAKKMLDYLVIVLKNNVDIKIQFTGHTDALGSSQFNQVLSEKRAQAAKSYLVKKGIPAGSIKVIGLGESMFIAINQNKDGSDNPEGRKFNRRVDVQIIEKKEDKKIIIDELKVPQQLKLEEF